MDRLTPAQRSALMRKVGVKNTAPELLVRRLIFRMGYRYRLHAKDLPGKPDIVFPSRHKVIFVHGCFWHGHRVCRQGRMPTSNIEYWYPKLEANRQRDRRNRLALKKMGWRVLTVWTCELKRLDKVAKRISSFLESE